MSRRPAFPGLLVLAALAALAGIAPELAAQVRPNPALPPLAQTAAAKPPLSGADPAPATIGRLFFTADRRATLDRLRLLNLQEVQQQQTVDPTVTVNGVVKRSGGPETAWINGAPQTSRAAGSIWSGSTGPASRIRLTPPGEATRQISVGETLYRSSGVVESPLGGGKISVGSVKRQGANAAPR